MQIVTHSFYRVLARSSESRNKENSDVNYFPGDATVNAKCYSNLLKGRLQNAPRTMVLRPVDTTTLFNFYISFLSPHYFIFIRIKEDIGVHTFSEMRIDVC
jgi:hypothetical protein